MDGLNLLGGGRSAIPLSVSNPGFVLRGFDLLFNECRFGAGQD